MRPLYHLTVLPPPMPAAEALSQEIATLRAAFGGEVRYLNPNDLSPVPIPRLLFGFQQLVRLRRAEASIDLHHFYNPDLFPFPLLGTLHRPVVYVVSSGAPPDLKVAGWGRRLLARLAAIVVPDERSAGHLRAAGLCRVHVVRSGIDLGRFSHAPAPEQGPFRLLMASAPWTHDQFRSKGVDALLEAVAADPDLHVTFLWRGVLAATMARRIRQWGVEERVTLLNRQVDVNQILAGVHGAVALADAPGIVKSFPHSLLDALAAGKPVLVSRAIPMADYVVETGCGQVVESLTAGGVRAAVTALRARYTEHQQVARQVGRRDFSARAMVDGYRRVYSHVLHQGEFS